MKFSKHGHVIYRRKAFFMLILNFEFVWHNFNFRARGVFILLLGLSREGVTLRGSSQINLSKHGDVTMLEIEVEHGAMSTLTIYTLSTL